MKAIKTWIVVADGDQAKIFEHGGPGKVLQAIVFRGGNRVWVGGKGGTLLKRTEPLSPKNIEPSGGRPILRSAPGRTKPKPRVPLVTVTDDGDIPAAVPPKKT